MPPPITALVEEAAAAIALRGLNKSPKSVVFPVDAMVTYSIKFTESPREFCPPIVRPRKLLAAQVSAVNNPLKSPKSAAAPPADKEK